MIKKLILILLCTPGLLAMTQVKLSAPLKVQLKDGTVEVARYLAEFSGIIQENHSFCDDDTPVSLPQLTKYEWELIHEPLALAYLLTRDKTERAYQMLLETLMSLSADELLSCMKSADYLGMQELFAICLELAYKGHLDRLSYEQLRELPSYYVDDIIFRRACATCGPYEVTPFSVCTGHEGSVFSVCTAPDGTIISGSEDKTVRVWDSEGNQLAVCEGHEDMVSAVCVTKNGKIVSGSADGTIRVWDPQGKQLAVCEGHEGKISTLYILNGIHSISIADRTMRKWDEEGNQLSIRRGFRLSPGKFFTFCLGPDDNKAVSITSGVFCTFEVFDLKKRPILRARLRGEFTASSVCVTRDDNIIVGSDDGMVRICDMKGNQLAICKGHEGCISELCMLPNGNIVSGSFDGTVRIWDIQGNQLAVCGHNSEVRAVCVTLDGKIVSASNRRITIWDTLTLSLTETQAEKIWLYLQKVMREQEEQHHVKQLLQRLWGYLKNDPKEQVGWKHIKQLLQEDEELPTHERN